MRTILITMVMVALLATGALAGEAEGLITIKSNHGVADTADRLQAAIEAKGINLFARIDHGANAAKVGNELAPMQLLIFGKAQMGTRLMQGGPTVGIDLPLKALVWQDADGAVWISYNDPAYLAGRHHVQGGEGVVAKMSKVLGMLTEKAAE